MRSGSRLIRARVWGTWGLPEADLELVSEGRPRARRKLLPKCSLWAVGDVGHRAVLERKVFKVVGVDVCGDPVASFLDSVDAPTEALHLFARHRQKWRQSPENGCAGSETHTRCESICG